MNSIFEYLSYREWLRDFAEIWKKQRPGHTLNRLAIQAEVQPPYLTNVLKERAHLNADQFYAMAEVFGLSADETQHGLLLLDWERSGSLKRRQALKDKIDLNRKEKLKSENHLNAEKIKTSSEDISRFYLNPDLQLVHTFLGIPRYAKNIDLIAHSLHMEPATVDSLVKELKELGFISVTAKGIEKTKKSIHLPKESPICRPQQLLRQHRSLQHMQLQPESEKFNFNVMFTADEETREKIQREFMQFLKKTEAWVKEAPSENVYQLQFDLFSWSR